MYGFRFNPKDGTIPFFESDSSAEDKKADEKWEHFNWLSLTIMRCAIPETFRSTMSKETIAKVFLNDLEK